LKIDNLSEMEEDKEGEKGCNSKIGARKLWSLSVINFVLNH